MGGVPCYMLHGYMGGWWGIFAPLHVTWGGLVGGDGGCRVTVTWNCAFFHCYLLRIQVGTGLGVNVTCKM